jgi:hypothetical protein
VQQRENRVFADFVTAVFASLPPGAIVITMGDHLTGSVFYFREVEKLRPDVIHLDRELLGTSWYGERKRYLHPDLALPEGGYGPSGWSIKKLLDANPNRPAVVIDRLEAWDQRWKDGYKLATNGLVHPLVRSRSFRRLQNGSHATVPPSAATMSCPPCGPRKARGNMPSASSRSQVSRAAPTLRSSSATTWATPSSQRASRCKCSRTSSPSAAATKP